jgi:dihydroorotate dehydrogenase (fumarate)
MPSTATRYLGFSLKSPVMLSSSNLTHTMNGIRRGADAGAGAVVLKSLFEEQIEADTAQNSDEVDYSIHPEAEEYVRQMGKHLGPDSYLKLISQAKAEVDIPVIASVNCITPRWWGDYGRQIESAGADALELNIAIMPRERESAEQIESAYVRIIERVRDQVSIPLAVKIGPYFTSLPRLIDSFARAGAAAVVLFNRFYQFDIDTAKLELAPGYRLSAPREIHTALRWVSILSGDSPCEIVGSTAVYDGNDVVKMLLAGATAVQVCSTVIENGFERITEMNAALSSWMSEHDFPSIDSFRGRLCQAGSDAPEAHERLQYVRALTGAS